MNVRWLRLLCAGALTLSSLTSLLAHAQYSWIDDKGSRVFSDRPPPPGTPPSRILKSPGGLAPATLPPAAPAAPAAPAEASTPDWQKRDADYRARAAQREADEKKLAEEAKIKAGNRETCAAARAYERTLASGMRLRHENEKGEIVPVTEADRERQLQTMRRVAEACR